MAALTTAGEAPTEDSWNDKNQKIIVTTPQDGYLFDLKLLSKVCALLSQMWGTYSQS